MPFAEHEWFRGAMQSLSKSKSEKKNMYDTAYMQKRESYKWTYKTERHGTQRYLWLGDGSWD